jgi:hypothetical protein
MLMLYRIKKDPIFSDGAYRVSDGGSGVLTAEYRAGDRIMQGVFSTGGLAAEVRVPLRDGNYVNLIDGTEVRVSGGRLRTAGEPAIIDARLP